MFDALGPSFNHATGRPSSKRYDVLIGIGGNLTAPPLPHHRTCGSASGGSRSYAVALAGLSVSWAVNCDSVSSLPVPQASPARMEEKSSSVWIFRCLSLLRSMSYLPLLSFGPSVTVSGLACRVEDWRGAPKSPFPAPATSNRACRFPALGSPARFTAKLM